MAKEFTSQRDRGDTYMGKASTQDLNMSKDFEMERNRADTQMDKEKENDMSRVDSSHEANFGTGQDEMWKGEEEDEALVQQEPELPSILQRLKNHKSPQESPSPSHESPTDQVLAEEVKSEKALKNEVPSLKTSSVTPKKQTYENKYPQITSASPEENLKHPHLDTLVSVKDLEEAED